METKTRINRLIKITKNQIINLKILSNGELMEDKAFRLALKENSNLSQRLDNLEERKFKLERLFWKLC